MDKKNKRLRNDFQSVSLELEEFEEFQELELPTDTELPTLHTQVTEPRLAPQVEPKLGKKKRISEFLKKVAVELETLPGVKSPRKNFFGAKWEHAQLKRGECRGVPIEKSNKPDPLANEIVAFASAFLMLVVVGGYLVRNQILDLTTIKKEALADISLILPKSNQNHYPQAKVKIISKSKRTPAEIAAVRPRK